MQDLNLAASLKPLINSFVLYPIVLYPVIKNEKNNIDNPKITSNVGFHDGYNNIIIPLMEGGRIIIITDIVLKIMPLFL